MVANSELIAQIEAAHSRIEQLEARTLVVQIPDHGNALFWCGDKFLPTAYRRFVVEALERAGIIAGITVQAEGVAMFKLEFQQKGTFTAWYAAQKWMDENGYSYGSTCAVSGKVGVLRGDYYIAKWRNLTNHEIRDLDGVIQGDFRDGPLTLTLKRQLENQL